MHLLSNRMYHASEEKFPWVGIRYVSTVQSNYYQGSLH